MSKNERKNAKLDTTDQTKKASTTRLLFVMIIFCVAVLVFIKVVSPMIFQKPKSKVEEKSVQTVIDNAATGSSEAAEAKQQIEQYMNMLSEEDRKAVEDILSDHMDDETISQVMEYVDKKDKEGLAKFAASNLSPMEIFKLMQIYEKYSN